MDFEQVGVLPESFMSFALDMKFKDPLPLVALRMEIPIERTKNLRPVFRAYRILQIAVEEFGK